MCVYAADHQSIINVILNSRLYKHRGPAEILQFLQLWYLKLLQLQD